MILCQGLGPKPKVDESGTNGWLRPKGRGWDATVETSRRLNLPAGVEKAGDEHEVSEQFVGAGRDEGVGSKPKVDESGRLVCGRKRPWLCSRSTCQRG